MKKHLQLSLNVELVRYPQQTAFTISLNRESLRDWCLGLSLLKEDLIETLAVSAERGKRKFEIELLASAGPTVRAQADFSSETTRLKITPNHADYLLHFFLKYYRDGAAEVDHVDVEAASPDEGSEGTYITFKVPDSSPPLSPEEAERRLRG
jgi:hypothetical protein